MLHVLFPSLLALLGLLAIPVILHVVRPRPRTVRTATLAFFQALHRHQTDAPWLQKLKRLLAVLLALLLVTAAVLALARPVLSPRGAALATVAVLIDRSASMDALSGADQLPDATQRDDRRSRMPHMTRMTAALRTLRAQLAGLPLTTAVAVIVHDRRTAILLSPTTDRRQLERVLADIEARPVAGDDGATAEAMATATRIAAIATPAAVWAISDDPAAPQVQPPLPIGVALNVITVASPANNVGITACDIRRKPLEADGYELFVAIAATTAAPAPATLRLHIDQRLVSVRTIDLAAGISRESMVMPLTAGAGGELRVTIDLPGDALAYDNSCELRIPPKPRVDVVVMGQPDGFTTLALAALKNQGWLAISTLPLATWRDDKPGDVLVYCATAPAHLPPGRAALLLDPPFLPGAFRGEHLAKPVFADPPRSIDPHHPVLFGVAQGRVALSQTWALSNEGGLSPLWGGPAGTVLAAADVDGLRTIVAGYATDRSQRLGFTAAQPILLANAVLWLAQPKLDQLTGQRLPSGSVITVSGNTFRWHDGSAEKTFAAGSGDHVIELDRIGRWQTDTGEFGSAAVLAEHETLLGQYRSATVPAAAGVAAAAAITTSPGAAGRWWSGELTTGLIVLILVILAMEAWLAHRRGVH